MMANALYSFEFNSVPIPYVAALIQPGTIVLINTTVPG